MTTKELIRAVDSFLDSRNLADPSIRKRAIRKVVDFMESTGKFVSAGNVLALPSDKNAFKNAYARYKGYDLNSAESSAINHMYEVSGGGQEPVSADLDGFLSSFSSKITKRPANTSSASVPAPASSSSSISDAEARLINGNFASVSGLDGSEFPEEPGLYCIKLRKGVTLPAKFGKIREDGIIYIGQTTDTLKKRLWESELNHKHLATFFRSIGAILGYLPPKGSLVGKSNTRNYKFSASDTETIKKWIRQSLLVNCIPFKKSELDRVEQALIEKYTPLVNIKHNPAKSAALEEARATCVIYANTI